MGTHFVLENLDDLEKMPSEGILSRTLLDTAEMKLVLFHFAAGEELSEHTASVSAVVQVLAGEMRLTLGDDTHDAVGPGSFVYMPAHLRHAVFATRPSIMLLQLLKQPRSG